MKPIQYDPIEKKFQEIEASEDNHELTCSPAISFAELLQKKYPEQEWLVKELIPANSLTIFSAPPGTYKTRVLLNMAVAVTRGEPLFGKFETQQSGVLIVDEEGGERLLQKQLLQHGATNDSAIYIRSGQNFILSDKSVDLLLEDCKKHNLSVIIFDSLACIHQADENSATEMTPVMKHLKRLAKHVSVLVIAHDRKTGINGRRGNNELRGSSAILAACDAHIFLKKRGERLVIEQTKLRHARLHEPFELLIVSGSDESCDFEYLTTSKQDVDEAFKVAIANQLAEHDNKLCQKELLELLNRNGTKISEYKLRIVIQAMLDSDDLNTTAGSGNTTYYSLID